MYNISVSLRPSHRKLRQPFMNTQVCTAVLNAACVDLLKPRDRAAGPLQNRGETVVELEKPWGFHKKKWRTGEEVVFLWKKMGKPWKSGKNPVCGKVVEFWSIATSRFLMNCWGTQGFGGATCLSYHLTSTNYPQLLVITHPTYCQLSMTMLVVSIDYCINCQLIFIITTVISMIKFDTQWWR